MDEKQPTKVGDDKFWTQFQQFLDSPDGSSAIKEFLEDRGLALTHTYTEKLISEIGDIGFYEIDISKKRATRNDRWLAMLGYSQSNESNEISLWEKLIHPDDKIRTKEKIDSLFNGTSTEIEIEYRLRRADGKYLWLLDRSKVVEVDENGTPLKIAGIQANIDTLRKNQEEVNRLYELLEATPDYVSYCTKRGIIYFANKALKEVLGFDPKTENYPKLALKIHTKGSSDLLRNEAIPYATEHGLWQGETSIISKNGNEIPVYQTLICHKDGQGEVNYFSAIMRNIVEERQTIEALEQSEKKFRAFAETAQATIILHKGNQVIYVNPSFMELTGYTYEEALEMNVWKIVHPDDRQLVRSNGYNRLKGKDVPSRYEYRLLTKDGETKWIDFAGSSIQIDGENMVLGVAMDITESKEIEIKLKESEERYKSFAEMLPEIVLETDFQGKIKFVNRAALETFGYSKDELESLSSIYDFVHKDYIQKVKQDLRNLYEKNVNKPEEYLVCKRDGSVFPVLGSSSLVYEKNELVGFRTILLDVSAQKELEIKLKESESNLTQILENSDEAYALFDKQRNCVEFNDNFKNVVKKLHGVTVVEGMPFRKFVRDQDLEKWDHFIGRVQRGEKVNYVQAIEVDGQIIHAEMNVFPIKGSGRPARFAFNGRNITERINHELNLMKQERMLEGVNHAIFQLLTDQDIKTVTTNFLKTVGNAFEVDRAYIFQNVLNSDGQICMNQTFEWAGGDVNAVIDFPILQELPYHEAGLLRAYHILSRQKPFYGLVKDFPQAEKELLQSQEIISILICPIFIKGKFWGFMGLDDCKEERNWSPVEISMLFSLANSYGGSVEREGLWLEMKIAKEKAEDAYKEKTNFLSTMSHEIRTPMNSVIGMTQLLLQEEPREDQKENLDLLNFSAQNLLNLINDILDYSKIEANKATLVKGKFNLYNTIQSLLSTLKTLVKAKGLVLIEKIDNELDHIFISDSVKLIQILSNLMSNAIKFTESGSITFKAQQFDDTEDSVYVRFTIQDTGLGIENEKLSYIFESFTQIDSSEKRMHGGTGLGLAITKKLVELFGSEINVISEVGKGSTFYFDLKLEKAKNLDIMQLDEVKSNGYDDEEVVNGKRVLLVEDNKVNQVVANKFLQSWGMQVEIAENGLIALEILQKKDVDVVLMDLQMPVMDGITATKEIRKMKGEKWKKLPIIALTAAVLGEEEFNARNAGMDEFVSKPFNPKVLLNKISQVVLNKLPVVAPEPELSSDQKSKNDIRLKPNIRSFEEMANDDKDFLIEILSTFNQLMQETKRNYRKALIGGNLDEVKRIKHKIKAELLQVDALVIDDLMEHGKQIIVNAESSKIENNILKIEKTIDILIAFLNTEINKIKNESTKG